MMRFSTSGLWGKGNQPIKAVRESCVFQLYNGVIGGTRVCNTSDQVLQAAIADLKMHALTLHSHYFQTSRPTYSSL